MEQLTLFGSPNKYIIDTSSILSQKIGEPHTRQVYKGQWLNIEKKIRDCEIVTCSEVLDEIHDRDIKDWLMNNQCKVFDIDDEIQKIVRMLVTENPKMIEFTGKSETSSGDAFLIATAIKYHLTVITEENRDKNNKIPQICLKYNVKSINITRLCEIEGWEF